MDDQKSELVTLKSKVEDLKEDANKKNEMIGVSPDIIEEKTWTDFCEIKDIVKLARTLNFLEASEVFNFSVWDTVDASILFETSYGFYASVWDTSNL